MAIHIVEEANRCLNCKNPRCQQGCPVHTHIPEIIGMFKENRLMEAGEKLSQNNPMSVICLSVCNHEKQCEGNCVLGKKGQPVHFSHIENYISDMYLDRMKLERQEEKKERVAVIGSGPAGLTVAIQLAQKGYPVTIFERSIKQFVALYETVMISSFWKVKIQRFYFHTLAVILSDIHLPQECVKPE